MQKSDNKIINYLGPDASIYWACYTLAGFLRKDINEIFSGLITTSITLGKLPACEEVVQEYLATMGIEKRRFKTSKGLTLRALIENITLHMNDYKYDRILVFQGKWFPTLIIRGKDNYEEAFDDSGYREEYMGSGYYLKPYYYVNIKDIKAGSKNSVIKKQKLISHNQKFEVETDESNQYFEYFNPNPTSAWVGDCGTRAICVALNKSWKDVVLMVAEHSFRHRKPYKASYEDILIDNGFVEYPEPKAKGHRITVRKFIEQKAAEKYYKNRICFVVRGGYIPHMVTAKLEGDRYRIYDTWDSSVRYIDKYFVSKR